MATVGGGGLGHLKLIEALFELPVPGYEIPLQTLGIHYRVIGGMGIDEACISKELATVNETSFNALPHDTLKKALEGLRAPPGSRLAQDTVVRDLTVEIVAQKIQPVQAFGNGEHEFSLGSDIVEDQKEHHLKDYRGRHGGIALRSIGVFDLVVDEVKVDGSGDPSEWMIVANPFV